jgi:hypothetical protein
MPSSAKEGLPVPEVSPLFQTELLLVVISPAYYTNHAIAIRHSDKPNLQ